MVVEDEVCIPQVVGGNAGIDLIAICDGTIECGQQLSVSTGLSMAIPTGHKGIIRGRSGMRLKYMVEPFRGVIDSSYRGTINVLLINYSPILPFNFKRGDRIAQLCIEVSPGVTLSRVSSLGGTFRGSAGFGSTGR